MGNERKCVVSFRDQEGVEHVAEVIAESLYEAGALALQQFRRGEWSREASLDTGALRVEVCESTFYKLSKIRTYRGSTGPRQISPVPGNCRSTTPGKTSCER
jgi:hypothetical protein